MFETYSQKGLAIANKGIDNPVLMYDGKPALKIGPMPEVDTFAYPWGAAGFDHEAWTDWMVENGLGYGRIYPSSGIRPSYQHLINEDAGRVFPFRVSRWEGNRPIVDLNQFDPAYWAEMANTIEMCAQKGIVLHLQLYQRCYFNPGDWEGSFFNPQNNVNGYEIGDDSFHGLQTGHGIWKEMLDNPKLWAIHERYVMNILDAVGSNGNVFIDLINEAGEWDHSNRYRRWGMYKEWVKRTIDVIERWERSTGNDILISMYLHAWDDAEYVKSHPRMDLIIISAGDIVNGQIEHLWRYKKPLVAVHNNFAPYWPPPEEWRVYHVHDAGYPQKRLYQWMGMMQKVQGLGVYAKQPHTTNLSCENAMTYARQSRVLMDVFNSFKEYGSMRQVIDHFESAPGFYKVLLASEREAVVYLHTYEYGRSMPVGEMLRLEHLDMPDGQVSLRIIHPSTGRVSTRIGCIEDRSLAVELPEFYEDIAVYFRSPGHSW